MNRYLAKITFQIICGNGHHTPQFDEQLRMIIAEDERQALQKAKQLGADEEDSFFNEERRLVQWKFIGITKLLSMNELADGAEVCSRIEEFDYAEPYIALVRRRAELLERTAPREKLQLI